MDARVARLKTPAECQQFVTNIKARLPEGSELTELIRQAGRLAVELSAAKHGAKTTPEREALEAIYALEAVTGKRASRTWPMVERHGILQAVERIVKRPLNSSGYHALVVMGMEDKLFESVVLRHPNHFSPEAVKQSEERLRQLAQH